MKNYVSDTHDITFGTCDVVSDIRNPTGSLDSLGTRLGLYLIHGSNTGGKGIITQWVHGEFIVSFETIRLVNTHQVCVEYF